MLLNLEKPLACFDIESTGINRKVDRIIDLAIVRIEPDGQRANHVFRVNPGIPIPPESSAIHGIFDEDVAHAPSFAAVADRVIEVLEGCDLAGFNIRYFDVPLLCAEFERVDKSFDVEERVLLDAQRIFHKMEPRDLSAGLRFYCNEEHTGAHGALDDTLATVKVLEAQLARYPELPHDVAALEIFCDPRDPSWVDRTGKLKWDGDEVVINFGRNQGRRLRDLARFEPGFLDWMLKGTFPRDTLDIVRKARAGSFPVRGTPTEPGATASTAGA